MVHVPPSETCFLNSRIPGFIAKVLSLGHLLNHFANEFQKFLDTSDFVDMNSQRPITALRLPIITKKKTGYEETSRKCKASSKRKNKSNNK
jgi:hypothetical protein